MDSAWVSNKKYLWASRESGELTVIGHRGKFKLLSDRAHTLEAGTLEEAIHEADWRWPPKGWRGDLTAARWSAPGWRIDQGALRGIRGWVVCAEDGLSRSQHVFSRADLARKWCEIRGDRVGMNLRGPKPAPGKTKKPRKAPVRGEI